MNGEGVAEDNVSAPSSFIANAQNEQYDFLYRKRQLIEKNAEPVRGGRPTAPFKSATGLLFRKHYKKIKMHNVQNKKTYSVKNRLPTDPVMLCGIQGLQYTKFCIQNNVKQEN